MAATLCLTLAFILTTSGAFGIGCDEFSWDEVQYQYDACINKAQGKVDGLMRSSRRKVTPELCSTMDELLDCSQILSICMDSHMEEAEERLFSMPIDVNEWASNMLACQQLHGPRFKRSPGRTNGGSSSGSSSRGGSPSRTSTVSRVASRGKEIVKGILNNRRGSPSGSSSSGSSSRGGVASRGKEIVKGILNNRRKTTSGGSGGGSGGGKKKLLKKVGKYAVAGLAAYGIYKGAKAMSKGLRREYDDDDCWEYSFRANQYECVCSHQCNVYVGSVANLGCSSVLLIVSMALSYYYTRNNNF